MRTIQLQDRILNLENVVWFEKHHSITPRKMTTGYTENFMAGPYEYNWLIIELKQASRLILEYKNQKEMESEAERLKKTMEEP